jgi:hypothetical protein
MKTEKFAPPTKWVIRGYDSQKMIYSTHISSGLLSNRQMEALLKTLTAKASLTFDEIVGAYVRRGSSRSNQHLEITHDGAHHQICCGSNPHFIAKISKVGK